MKEYLLPIIRAAVQSLGAPEETEITLELPRQAEHGDLATNVAMGLARPLKKAPRQIAEEIVGRLELDSTFVSGVEIAGPGFINFRFTPAFYQAQLDRVSKLGERYGRSDMGHGIKTNIEYVSANPTGLLHPGHGRGAAIGDTVANILDWAGYEVTREYYFNNAGNQMRNLARSIHSRYLERLKRETTFPEDGYHGEYIYDIADEAKAKYGESLVEPTAENLEIMRQLGEEWSFARIKQTLEALGIRHDVYFNEDSLYKEGKITEVIEELKSLGRTYEKDGALWIRADDSGEKDRVIVKSTGEPTYRLPDTAYHREKFRRGFELIIDVLGADHKEEAEDVRRALEILGFDSSKIRVIMNQMVTFVQGGQPVKLSKRSGKALTLDELLEDFGADVVRYFFIMRSANSQFEFDMDLAREQSEKNPVFYLQYAHARIAGVLRHAEAEGVTLDPEASLEPLVRDEELDLIKEILSFPESVRRAARDLDPQTITEYLRGLAAAFHKFYHECRILIDDAPLRAARMRLLAAAKVTLGNGLRVLGVTAPERM